MSTALPSPRRRRLQPDERRAQLLAVTAQLLTGGSAEVSVPDVADAAGVSPNLVYTYFNNRAGLLLALLDETADRFDEQVRDRLASSSADEDWLGVSTRVYFDAVEALGPIYVALLHSSHAEDVVDERRRQRQDAHVQAVTGLLRHHTGAPADACAAHAAVIMAALNAAAELVVLGSTGRADAEGMYLALARPAVEHLRTCR